MDKKTKGMLLVVAAAFFIGTEAIFAKLVICRGQCNHTITLRLPGFLLYSHSHHYRSQPRILPKARHDGGLILAILLWPLCFFRLLPCCHFTGHMLLYAYPFNRPPVFLVDGELLSKEKILALFLSALGLVFSELLEL